MWGVSLLATLGTVLAPAWLPRWPITVGWPLLLASTYVIQTIRRRRHVSAHDCRAAALCGNSEALVGALCTLATLTHTPRRQALQEDAWTPRPSLAHRIQAIRAVHRPWAPDMPTPVPAHTATPGTFVIFTADHVAWLAGVPPDTSLDAPLLRARAASLRAVRYPDLAELRVQTELEGPASLLAADQYGTSWVVPLRAQDVATVQATLDRIDTCLAPLRPAYHWGPLGGKLLAALAMVCGWVMHNSWVAVAGGFVGVLHTSRATFAAIGVTTLGNMVFTLWMGEGWLAGWWQGRGMASLALMVGLEALVGSAALWGVGRRRRAGHEQQGLHVTFPCAIFGLLTLLVWLTNGVWLVLSPDPHALETAVGDIPPLILAPLGLCAALLTVRRPRMRWASAGALALTLVPLGIQRPWLQEYLLGRQLWTTTPLDGRPGGTRLRQPSLCRLNGLRISGHYPCDRPAPTMATWEISRRIGAVAL